MQNWPPDSCRLQDRLADVTQSHATDAVTIEKLTADYQTLHGLMEKSGRELDETRHELDSHVKQIEGLMQQAADSKTANEKTISELQAKLATAQSNEKDMSAKVATLGQDVTQLTSQCQKEALSARSGVKTRNMKMAADRKDNELGKARASTRTSAQQTASICTRVPSAVAEAGRGSKLKMLPDKMRTTVSRTDALITETGRSEILKRSWRRLQLILALHAAAGAG